MLKYIINLYILLSVSLLFSQEAKKDSIRVTQNKKTFIENLNKFNLRIGFDIGNYIYGSTEDLKRINFYTDTNLFKDYFISVHFGNEEYLFDNQLINMSTSGNYWMFGVDYNLYDNWPGMDNQIMLGLHYGHASFTNHLTSYIINNLDQTFPSQEVIINKDFDNLSAYWLEIQSILQVEVLKNIYLGYNISLKYLLSEKRYDEFELTYIPGFRKVNSTSRYGFGMQYFISYRFK